MCILSGFLLDGDKTYIAFSVRAVSGEAFGAIQWGLFLSIAKLVVR